jgi:hypothetical protein
VAVPGEVSVLATGDLSGVAAALDRVAAPAAFLVVGSGLDLERPLGCFRRDAGKLDAGGLFLTLS